ncbi:MAG: hypothetical protein Q8L06_08215, partial [Pseudohongiella sp.]|nr:hypothetical protein [Pseudohongiella sp.]
MSDRKIKTSLLTTGWMLPVLVLSGIQGDAAAQVPGADNSAPQPQAGIMQDWATRENMSAEQAARVNPACCGMFVEPEISGDNADLDPDSAPTEIETTARVNQPEPAQLYVEGDVS